MQADIQQGKNGRLEISGDLNFDSVAGLWRKCHTQFSGCETLDIDLSGVQRSDSAGVALLVDCLRQAHQSGKAIRFFNIPTQMLALARVSSLDQVLPLQRD
ncbi:MAG TPA: STAS domain-containing protein [Gammaproteobacteria bacterium]|nr:STAS domain-containing protein [Gammaproteobacteria bacterium]